MKRLFLLLVFIVFLSSNSLFAKTAFVKKLQGHIIVKRDGKILPVELGFKLESGDVLFCKEKSSIGLIFHDGTIITLGENSIFRIEEYIFEPVKKNYSFKFELTKGTASFKSGKIGKLSPQSVKFKIPEGVIGIRGTKFYVEVKK